MTKRGSRRRLFAAALAALVTVMASRPAAAGTALVIKSGDSSVLARNLDSPSGDGYVFVNKRGVVKEAFGGAGAEPLRWTSKYGSVTFNQLGREFPWGGINEQGLVIEALPGPAGYPALDQRPPLTELQWVQYQLDNHRSVKEVLKSDRRLRISKLFLDLHFLVADRSGKTAVIEFAEGRMASFTGGKLPVRALAEESYAESLRRLDEQLGLEGRTVVPVGQDPEDRFIRTAAMLQDFVWPVQGILSDHAFSVLRSVERPDTQWNIVYNIPRRLVFFKTRTHRWLKMIRLESFDFSCAAPVLMLPVDTGAGRVVNEAFEPYDPQKNRGLLETVLRKLEGPGAAERPPVDVIRKMSEYPATCSCRS
jgi:penicillin V acylase-like amidase (Ntn superfamily)